MTYFCLLLVFGMGTRAARANEVQSQTSVGTGSLVEEISYNGDSGSTGADAVASAHGKTEKNKDKAKWTWDLSYTYSAITLGATAQTPAAPATSAAVDHTNAVTTGFGYENGFSTGLDLNYSKTNEENLMSFGPSVRFGYTFDLGTKRATKPKLTVTPKTTAQTTPALLPEDSSSEEGFSPTLNFTATLGTTKYTQDFLTAVRVGSRRKPIPKVASQSISQNQAEIAATFSALEWLELEVSLTTYHYNRDVGSFISSLDDPRAIRSGAASFGSTLSGFSSSAGSVSLMFHLPADIDLLAQASRDTSASDGSKTSVYKVDLSKLWADTWKTGVCFERDKSTMYAQNIGIFTLSYQFE